MDEGYGFGKVILFNEHFVVHGVLGIMSAIGATTDAEAKKPKNPGINIIDERKGTAGYDL
jgi:mevalonate kinase